jgi:hypothetical protein
MKVVVEDKKKNNNNKRSTTSPTDSVADMIIPKYKAYNK